MNPHERTAHKILSLARLPVPTLPHDEAFASSIAMYVTHKYYYIQFELNVKRSFDFFEKILRDLRFCRLDKRRETFRIVHGHVREDFTVQVDIRLLKAVHELAVA